MGKSRDDEAVEAMAAAWLAHRDDGFTREEEQEFAQWRAQDPRHEAAVARLGRAWETLQQLRDFRPAAPAHPDLNLLAQRPPRRDLFSVLVTLGGVCTALLLIVLVLHSRPRSRIEHAPLAETTFTTTEGGYQRISLPDGSLIVLNASSEVRSAFTPEERRVRLRRGEAHFTVAKDPARPFRVEAGTVEFSAVGTAFNVRLGPSRVEVLVTEGRVHVAKSRSTAPAVARPAKSFDFGENSFIDAGRRMILPVDISLPAPAQLEIELLPPQVIRTELAWQEPWLVFIDTPLSEVVAQFNRRNSVQITIADAELSSLPIGGTFRTENLDAFVRLLATSNDVLVERAEIGRIVLRARR